MLCEQELMQIQMAAEAMTGPAKITLYKTGAGGIFETKLANIAAQIAGVSMNRIELDESTESIIQGKPSLSLSSKGPANIHYLAAPEGHEFQPFLNALKWVGLASPAPDRDLIQKVNSLSEATSIMVLIANTCEYCPRVVHSVLEIAVHNPTITAMIVDAIEFGDLAETFKVQSVPTTILNSTRTIVGHIGINELIDQLLGSQAPNTLTADLESMIQSGRAEDAATLLCSREDPTAILPLYISKEFSKRIGALVTLEESLRINPRILDPVLNDLIKLLSSQDVGLRGDTAELLGKIGNPAAIPALEDSLDDPDPDVREAAVEALEILRTGSGPV